MMRIALVNLPWRIFGKTGVRAGSRWPHLKGRTEKDYLPFPFFLSYAAALLKQHGFDVRLLDAIAEGVSYGGFLSRVHKFKPRLLVCETSTVTLEHDLRLLAKINKNISIALCGPDINIRHPVFLKDHEFISYIIVGEYEMTLLDLARHMDEGKGLEGVAGLIYRDGAEIMVNPARPLVELDKLPWPLRDGLRMERYNDTPGDMPLPSVQMLASRGCPYQCKFCLWPQVMYQGSNYRVRSISDVVDEMEYLVKEMHFKSVYFDDDTFNCGKERMLKLCSEIKRRGLNVPWAIMARADLMDEEILESMRQAGLFAVKYGVESASQKLLDNINKNMSIKKTQDIIKFTKSLGIKTHLTFTFGVPGESKETLRSTLDFALRMDPTTVQFSIATPFPGTAFYAEMKKSGRIISEKWTEYDGNHKSVIYSNDLNPGDLEKAIKSAYREWVTHCLKRRPLRRIALDAYYCQALSVSLKKYGLFATLWKAAKFFARYSVIFLKERSGYSKTEIQRRISEGGLKVGRLALILHGDALRMYWDGVELTRGQGFLSSLGPADGRSCEATFAPCDLEKIGDTRLVLTRRCRDLPVEESWRIEAIDEKQLDWVVEINVKNDIEIPQKRLAIVLSEKYRKWVDIWGEGIFPPVNNHKEVELRNPDSDFIGLRGRKKVKGQLPTVLFDLFKNDGDYLPSIRNAASTLGARVLEARERSPNGNGKYSSGRHRIFSARVKIVEEDFKKRKLNNGR